MQSFRTKIDPRRQAYLLLAGQVERQLRDAYDRKFKAGLATQSSLADKLGVNRSAVHHRLMGHTNMTLETLADMVWALKHAIKVEVFDPTVAHGLNYSVISEPPLQPVPAGGVTPARTEPIPGLIESLQEQAGSLIPVAA